jgi:hypothetical protein
MEDAIGVVIFIVWIVWSFLSRKRKTAMPIGPAPSSPDEEEVEPGQVPYDYHDGPPPRYYVEEAFEAPPALFVESAGSEPAPEPAMQKPDRVVSPPVPAPGPGRRARRIIPNLKEAVAWSEILAPPVALRTDETREV